MELDAAPRTHPLAREDAQARTRTATLRLTDSRYVPERGGLSRTGVCGKADGERMTPVRGTHQLRLPVLPRPNVHLTCARYRHSTASLLTAATLIDAAEAGITAAAGTRLALQ